MSVTSNSSTSEIDLSEIFASLWAHKFLICLFVSVSILLSAYYAITSERRFTATSIFQIKEGKASGINLASELGALASLAGLSGGDISETAALLKRLSGREFILNLSNNLSLSNDPYFNSYDPKPEEVTWKTKIKTAMGLKKTLARKETIVENNIVSKFRSSVKLEEVDGGAIAISVSHPNSDKAAMYANKFMEEIRLLVKQDNDAAQYLRLSYLSETLADSLQEMERAEKKLKDYALQNSAMAQENFISGSLKLDEIRMERKKVNEIANLLGTLENLVMSGNLDRDSYEALRSTQPLVDDIDFRRILGMSETISDWTWPDLETIFAVSTTLRDRINRLDVEINNIEENAKIYATSAEELAKFTRDFKVAEATYKVLIEQVKSQALVAGFQPETFKVFEYATPPIGPSSPKRNLILTLGAVLGFFLGCVIALVNSLRRGVYYTKAALFNDLQPQVALRSKSVRRLSRKSISIIRSTITKRRFIVTDEAEIKLANKKLIYILDFGGRTTASGMARILSTQSSNSGRKVVLCDQTTLSEKEIDGSEEKHNSGFSLVNLHNKMSVAKLEKEPNLFTSSNFDEKIKNLLSNFDQIYVCTSSRQAILGVMALKEFNPSLVVLASLRKTRKLDIRKIRDNQPVDILFYD